jgi:hypothetical protein
MRSITSALSVAAARFYDWIKNLRFQLMGSNLMQSMRVRFSAGDSHEFDV